MPARHADPPTKSFYFRRAPAKLPSRRHRNAPPLPPGATGIHLTSCLLPIRRGIGNGPVGATRCPPTAQQRKDHDPLVHPNEGRRLHSLASCRPGADDSLAHDPARRHSEPDDGRLLRPARIRRRPRNRRRSQHLRHRALVPGCGKLLPRRTSSGLEGDRQCRSRQGRPRIHAVDSRRTPKPRRDDGRRRSRCARRSFRSMASR